MTEERLSHLENQVNELAQTVEDLQGRLADLEGLPSRSAVQEPVGPSARVESVEAAAVASDQPKLSASKFMGLLGRSTLVLAGGFLLRVLTESGSIPPQAGFAMGMVYSLGLIFATYRILAGRGHMAASGIGLTAAIVAYPFLTESITKLHLVSVVPGAIAVGVITAAGLWTAWHWQQRFLSWVFCLAALGTILGLGFTSGEPEFFGILLLLLGAATTLLAYTRRWHLKRWVVGIATNIVFFRLTIIATNPEGMGSGRNDVSANFMLVLDLALLVVYLGFFCYRALVQGKGVRVFDVVQSALVLAVGFGGATRIANATGHGADALGWTALGAALAFYTVAFTVVRSRLGRGRGFFYFASLALIFLFLGSQVVAEGPWLCWIWLVLSLVMTALGSHFDRVTLRYHSVIYLGLASLQTGLLAAALDAFTGAASSPWRALETAGAVNVAVALICYVILILRKGRDTDSRARRMPIIFAAGLSLVGLGYLSIYLSTSIVTDSPPAADPALIAVVRTSIMAVTAIALAFLCRRPLLRELSWLVYPLLALGGLKLLVEDLPQGSPLTLSVAFGFYGAALIFAPRLLAGRRKAKPENVTQ